VRAKPYSAHGNLLTIPTTVGLARATLQPTRRRGPTSAGFTGGINFNSLSAIWRLRNGLWRHGGWLVLRIFSMILGTIKGKQLRRDGDKIEGEG
jgi:hypothetical protein